jgi:hypothetical protein
VPELFQLFVEVIQGVGTGLAGQRFGVWWKHLILPGFCGGFAERRPETC